MTYVEEFRKELLDILEGTTKERLIPCLYGRISKEKPIFIKREVGSQFVRARRILRTIGENSGKHLSDKYLEGILLDTIQNLKYMEESGAKEMIDSEISQAFYILRHTELKKSVFLIPIMNLTVQENFEIGNTKFINLNGEELKKIAEEYNANLLLVCSNYDEEAENLNSTNETSAYALVTIEASDPEKANEVAHLTADFSLNIIRLFNKVTPMRLRNEYSKEIPSWILTISEESKFASHGMASHNLEISDTINKTKIDEMRKIGLDTVLLLVSKESPKPFEESILTSIFWFGSAVKDKEPIIKFLKCIIVLETLLTQGNQNKSTALSKRLASSLYINNSNEDKKQIFKGMMSLYKLRNKIAHGGHNTVVKEDLDSVFIFAQHLILFLIKYVNRCSTIDELFETVFVIDDTLYQEN